MARGGGILSSSSDDEDVADDTGRFVTVALVTFCAFFRAGFSSVTLLLLFGDSTGVPPRLAELLIQLGNGLEA
jgi:hypothetical protein